MISPAAWASTLTGAPCGWLFSDIERQIIGSQAAPPHGSMVPMDAAQASRRGRLVRRVALDTRPLSVPAYRRTLIGQGGSYVGTMITEVAVPVQIYADSRSSLYVGLAGLAGLVPIVILGLYGGAIADAVDRRRLALWSSLVTWAVTVLLLAQALLGLRSIALILALVVVQS